MPDRERRDQETRTRVDEIAKSVESWQEHVKTWQSNLDRRLQRVVWLMIVCAAITALLVPMGYLSLQGQRLRATRVACLQRNEAADVPVRILIALKVRPAVIDIARRNSSREPDCEEYARTAVGGWTLFGGPRVETPPPPDA